MSIRKWWLQRKYRRLLDRTYKEAIVKLAEELDKEDLWIENDLYIVDAAEILSQDHPYSKQLKRIYEQRQVVEDELNKYPAGWWCSVRRVVAMIKEVEADIKRLVVNNIGYGHIQYDLTLGFIQNKKEVIKSYQIHREHIQEQWLEDTERLRKLVNLRNLMVETPDPVVPWKSKVEKLIAVIK